jgi:Ca-activated chloride channel homolog
MTALGSPWLLLLLVPLAAVAYAIFLLRKGRRAPMLFSSGDHFDGLPVGWRVRFRHLPVILMLIALMILIIASARPRTGRTRQIVNTEGIDIVLVLDISGSMAAEDFTPDNRLAVSKKVIADFIKGREGDRIGLVLFAGKAFTQCPLTVDHDILTAFLERAEIGLIEDGTAIGMALATASNRLRESEAKSKVVILLTDGVNNRGEIDPVTAAKLAGSLGIKVYAIGAGTNGYAPMPVRDPLFGVRRMNMKVEIDEKMLNAVAKETGGEYYRATDSKTLAAVYDRIDLLEKTEVELTHLTEYSDHFPPLLLAGFALLALGLLLETTVLRRVG